MAKPLRVLHLSPLYFRQGDGVIGGGERYVLELARHMADQTPTTLLSFGDQNENFTVGNLTVWIRRPSLWIKGQKGNPLWWGLPSAIAGFDVIHCHQKFIFLSNLAAALGRVMGKKVFVTDLGGGGWNLSAYVRTGKWYRGELHLSAYSEKIFRADPAVRHTVIYGGVDTKKFSPSATAEAGNYFLFVGRLLPHKGVDRVIEALAPDMTLFVVGTAYDERYFADLQRLAQGKAVRFLGALPDESLAKLYRECRAILLTSLYEDRYGGKSVVPELLGQTLLEGMACGKPAVATRVASLPEIVRDRENGLLVDPAHPGELVRAMRTLWDDERLATKYGAEALRTVRDKFTWPSVVERCLAFYAES